jgi:HSP20 family protein
MQKEINRMFETFFRGEEDEPSSLRSTWKPAVDLVEHDEEFVARVELPGVRKEDVKITMHDNVLNITGVKQQEKKEGKEPNYHRIERSYGSFQRCFSLPTQVKADKIDAEYKDGILTIRMPKSEEAKPKQIEVKVK